LKPFGPGGASLVPSGSSQLRRIGIRGAGVTLLAQASMFVVQLAGTLVLARVLVPSDFGVVAIATTFSIFLASIGQVGFPEAILQREDVNHQVASNLFWINMGIALALTLVFPAAGPLLAKIYGDARLTHIVVWTSLSILFTGSSVAHLALLNRAMRFGAVSANNIISRAVSIALSVLLAWAGWGYWALVASVVAQPLALSVGAWILCRWIPSPPRAAEGTVSLFRFALHVNGRWNLNYCTRNLDNALVGWRFGPGSLGFYKKAYDLFALPANQFFSTFPVAVSTLSRLARDPVQYRRYLLGGLSAVALVGMGLGGLLTLVGRDLVRIILGPGWSSSGWIFTFFGPGIGVMLLYGVTGMIHLSIGTPDRWLRWTVIELAVTALLFFAALPWGPAGIAVAWTASFWVLIIPAFRYAGKPIQLEIAPVVGVAARYLGASLLAGVAAFLLVREIPSLAALPHWTGALARLLVSSCVFGPLYLAAVALVHGGHAPLHQFAGVLREMISENKSSSQTASDQAVVKQVGIPVTVAAGNTS
jgi:polysaccharide transporter, PST family